MNAKPTFIYTLVAYRENGVDTCRNCVMGQSDSDFELSVFTEVSSLAKHWAKHQFNAPRGREYCSYEYTLLLNGRDEWSDPSWDAVAECDPESGEPWASLERKHILELVQAELASLNEAHRRAQAQAAATQELQRQAEARQALAAAEARDHAEFIRLQAKFGGGQ